MTAALGFHIDVVRFAVEIQFFLARGKLDGAIRRGLAILRVEIQARSGSDGTSW